MTVMLWELLSRDLPKAGDGLRSGRGAMPTVWLPPMPRADTVFISIVVHRERRAVSFITRFTDSFGLGAGHAAFGGCAAELWCLLLLVEGHPNELVCSWADDTIIPAMTTRDGAAAIAFGAMGGDYQPMGHGARAVEHARPRHYPQGVIPRSRACFWRGRRSQADSVTLMPGCAGALVERAMPCATAASAAWAVARPLSHPPPTTVAACFLLCKDRAGAGRQGPCWEPLSVPPSARRGGCLCPVLGRENGRRQPIEFISPHGHLVLQFLEFRRSGR